MKIQKLSRTPYNDENIKISRTPYDEENIKISRTPFINNNNHHKENPHQDENAEAPSQNFSQFTIVGILYGLKGFGKQRE